MTNEIKIMNVQQPDDSTCAHACLSMVTGIPIEDLIKRFSEPDKGLGMDEEQIVLTELGILPFPIPKTSPFLFPWWGFYLVAIPSANHLRKSHAIVVHMNAKKEKAVVYDPNEGRRHKNVYHQDCFNPGGIGSDNVFSYSDITFLKVMNGHSGNKTREELYNKRENNASIELTVLPDPV